MSFLARVQPYETEHELVRLGGDADGGYLIPDDLVGIRYCFSPGVSTTSNFEADLARRGIKCFLADGSVNAPPIQDPLFDFEKKFLGPEQTDDFITLSDWVSCKVSDDSDLILQMDIEGWEYAVLANTPDHILDRFRIMVVEFHKLDRLCDSMGFDLINLTFGRLLRSFDIVHIHPNNGVPFTSYQDITIPPVMEFSFLRHDRTRRRIPSTSFPHALDFPNAPRKRDIVLPEVWYRTTARS